MERHQEHLARIFSETKGVHDSYGETLTSQAVLSKDLGLALWKLKVRGVSLVESVMDDGRWLRPAKEGGGFIMEGKLLVMDDFSCFLSLY